MWRITLILNSAFLGVAALGAAVSQMRLRNNYLRYPDESRPLELLPAISHAALHTYWLTWLVPLIWFLVSIGLIRQIGSGTEEKKRAWVQLHTTATLLISALLLFYFITAGMLPFAKLYLYLSK